MKAELDIQKDASINDVKFCQSDVRFHEAIVDATKNPLMRLIMISVLEALQSVTNLVSYPFRERQQIAAQHEAMFKAILVQDASAAETALTQQMKYLSDSYLQAASSRGARKLDSR